MPDPANVETIPAPKEPGMMWQMGRALPGTLLPWHLFGGVALCIALLSFMSPQVGMIGRGLRCTLPALAVAGVCIHMASPSAFLDAFLRFRKVLLLGGLFLLQAAVRFAYESNATDLWRTFFWGPFFGLVFLLWIAAYAELGEKAFGGLKQGLLFTWCLSVALGIPALVENPGIARTTLGNNLALENAQIWAPRGVGEYSVYTSIPVCLLPMFSIASSMKGVKRALAFVLLAAAGASVVLSTFTMASVLLVLAVVAVLAAWVKFGAAWSHGWRLAAVSVVLGMLLVVYLQASDLPQAQRVIFKAERLFTGISGSGLAQGDETGRGAMFVDEMGTFASEPFLGYIPHVTGSLGFGHSSFSNSLVLFGIFGSLFWFGALFLTFRISKHDTPEKLAKSAVVASWTIMLLGGILNPLWHTTTSLAALFAFTMPVNRQEGGL